MSATVDDALTVGAADDGDALAEGADAEGTVDSTVSDDTTVSDRTDETDDTDRLD